MDKITKNKVQLKVLIDWFGLECDTIDNRLRTQKIVWLFQNSVSNIGYGFRWYIYGPYSKGLSDDCYEIMVRDKAAFDQINPNLTENTKRCLGDFKKKIDMVCEQDRSYNLLEAIASIDYISHVWPVDENIKCEEMFKILTDNKKNYHNGEPITCDDKFQQAFRIWQEDFRVSKVA